MPVIINDMPDRNVEVIAVASGEGEMFVASGINVVEGVPAAEVQCYEVDDPLEPGILPADTPMPKPSEGTVVIRHIFFDPKALEYWIEMMVRVKSMLESAIADQSNEQMAEGVSGESGQGGRECETTTDEKIPIAVCYQDPVEFVPE